MFHKFFCLTEMIQTFCFFVLLLNWSIHMHFFVTYHFRFTYHSVLCNIPSDFTFNKCGKVYLWQENNRNISKY